jgi:predicted PurR-regulated permease PerM
MAAEEPESKLSNRAVFGYAVVGALGVLAVAIAAMAVYAIRSLLIQILIAIFIAVSLDPAVRFMNRKGVKRGQAVAVIFLLAFVLVALFLWAVVPRLIDEGASLARDYPSYLDRLREQSRGLRSLEDRFNLQGRINTFAQDLPGQIGTAALSFGRRMFGALISLVLIITLTIYFMADLPRLRRNAVRLFPRAHRGSVNRAFDVVVDKVGAYMIGNLIVSAFAGVATLIICLVLQVPFALPLAVFVALTDLLPIVGATLGAVVTSIVALATTQLWPNTIILAVFFLLYQQLENYLIAPRVFRNAVQMPAVGVLLAALIGGTVLGLVGALMAIPIAAAIKVLASPVIRAQDAKPAPVPAPDPPVPPAPQPSLPRPQPSAATLDDDGSH